jgi:hypothetical protein
MHRRQQACSAPAQTERTLGNPERVFVAFDHTRGGKRLGRLGSNNLALPQAASVILRAVRNDRLRLSVSSGPVTSQDV